MVRLIPDNISKIASMDMGYLYGKVVRSMKVNGTRVSNMVRVLS